MPTNFGEARASPPWDVDVADPLEMLLPTCVTLPNSVILTQTVWANYGDLPENFDTSRPTFHGHSRTLEPTHIDQVAVWCSGNASVSINAVALH